MQIRVVRTGRDYVASLNEGDSVLFTSKGHPREGCATREVMIWMLANWGHANEEVVLEVKEWR